MLGPSKNSRETESRLFVDQQRVTTTDQTAFLTSIYGICVARRKAVHSEATRPNRSNQHVVLTF